MCYYLSMKTFIVNVYKNKKWITLGLSILYLLLFCFPVLPAIAKQDTATGDYKIIYLPFILFLAKFMFTLPSEIKNMSLWSTYDDLSRLITKDTFIINLICSSLMLACFILAIICIVRLFRDKKFYFIWSLIFAYLTVIVKNIILDPQTNSHYVIYFYPTAIIFFLFIILDIVYLVLERYYLFGLKEKLNARVAKIKTAYKEHKETEYKQSPEYRIEQLEKELQELKAQAKSNEEKQ